MSSSSHFVGHEGCPKCQDRGKDRAQDNLARYSNGSAYCYSCSYYERASRHKAEKAIKTAYRQSFTEVATLPPKWDQELNRRGLNASEKALFTYSPEMDRLIWRDGDFVEARCFFGKQPKTLSFGTKGFHLFGEGKEIVLVEDVFSAVRVGRVTSAVSLFGSVTPKPWMMLLTKLTKNVIIWLDEDKYTEAIKQARQLRLLGLNVSVVKTPLDPKEYSEKDITTILCEKSS